jgi:hypothetical protein
VVRAVAHDAAGNTGQDLSDAVFTIEQDSTSPTIIVNAPNGGEVWAANSIHNITWSAADDVGVTGVDLYYSTDGGATFTVIATGLANTGTYAWTVPNTPTSNAFVKAVAHDAAGNTGQDLSNGPFTITAPSGSSTDIYVWDMSWAVSQRGNWITVSVTLFVKRDADADGVAEASDAAAGGVITTLVLDHYFAGSLISSTTFENAKTNGSGQVTFTLKTQIGGEFHAEVTKMTKAGWNWKAPMDQDNPSCYAGAPAGGEVDCGGGFFEVTPTTTSTAVHVAVGSELPPMFFHANPPTLPALAFQSASDLFEVEEFIPIGLLTFKHKH